MAPDPASLDNLRDIVVPADIPWLPPAIGWRLVGAALLATLVAGLWRAWLRWRANAYRREALRELAVVEDAARAGASPAETAAALSALMKRAALAAFPRERVADLTGSDWLAFLDGTGGATKFSAGPGKDLPILALGGQAASANLDGLFAAARRWLRKHRVGEAGAGC